MDLRLKYNAAFNAAHDFTQLLTKELHARNTAYVVLHSETTTTNVQTDIINFRIGDNIPPANDDDAESTIGYRYVLHNLPLKYRIMPFFFSDWYSPGNDFAIKFIPRVGINPNDIDTMALGPYSTLSAIDQNHYPTHHYAIVDGLSDMDSELLLIAWSLPHLAFPYVEITQDGFHFYIAINQSTAINSYHNHSKIKIKEITLKQFLLFLLVNFRQMSEIDPLLESFITTLLQLGPLVVGLTTDTQNIVSMPTFINSKETNAPNELMELFDENSESVQQLLDALTNKKLGEMYAL